MALDFAALRTEFLARGFDYMSSGAELTRAKRFLVDAMHTIDDMEAWPYLQATSAGAAPLTVSDLGRVESVVTTTSKMPLGWLERAELVRLFGDLTTTGTPVYYYLTLGTIVNVLPVSTGSITVTYTKVGPDLVADSDVPLMPDRYRMAIVHLAVADALRDKSNHTEAQAVQQTGDVLIDRMRSFYGLQSGQTLSQSTSTSNSDDWSC